MDVLTDVIFSQSHSQSRSSSIVRVSGRPTGLIVKLFGPDPVAGHCLASMMTSNVTWIEDSCLSYQHRVMKLNHNKILLLF